jgi:hypothetical protein
MTTTPRDACCALAGSRFHAQNQHWVTHPVLQPATLVDVAVAVVQDATPSSVIVLPIALKHVPVGVLKLTLHSQSKAKGVQGWARANVAESLKPCLPVHTHAHRLREIAVPRGTIPGHERGVGGAAGVGWGGVRSGPAQWATRRPPTIPRHASCPHASPRCNGHPESR